MRFFIKAAIAVGNEPSQTDPQHVPGGATRFAPPNKLRERARAGLGELQAEQLAVQRMMRLTDETAEPPRHVVVIEDVTRGLGLDTVDQQRIQKAVAEANPEFSARTQTQRIFLTRGALVDLLRSMKHIDGDSRMEIAKRATAWWKKAHDTELNRSRSISKSAGHAGKVERWITVSGARIPIVGGKMHGPIAEKIHAHFAKRAKKKKGKGKGGHAPTPPAHGKHESRGGHAPTPPAHGKGHGGHGKHAGHEAHGHHHSATHAFKEGWEAGERAKIGDVTKLHGIVSKVSEDAKHASAEAKRHAHKSLVYTPPSLRKIDLEWR